MTADSGVADPHVTDPHVTDPHVTDPHVAAPGGRAPGGGVPGGGVPGGRAQLTVAVEVNGEARELAAGLTLAELIDELSPETRGVAAAVNDAVIPRSEWAARTLVANDRVEVLTAVQGG
jgi:sulfur carrier protein